MNPNSQNQRWSKWTITITPGWTKRPTFAEVQLQASQVGRKVFGSASRMRIRDMLVAGARRVVIEVLSEGHDVHDPQYVEYMRQGWTRFAVEGFGPGTTIELVAELKAGTRQDGTPADQLIIAPAVALTEEATWKLAADAEY